MIVPPLVLRTCVLKWLFAKYSIGNVPRDAARDNHVKSKDGDIPGYPLDIEKRQDITIMVDFH